MRRCSIRDPTGSTSKPVGRHASTDRWVDGRIGRRIDGSKCVTSAGKMADRCPEKTTDQTAEMKDCRKDKAFFFF